MAAPHFTAAHPPGIGRPDFNLYGSIPAETLAAFTVFIMSIVMVMALPGYRGDHGGLSLPRIKFHVAAENSLAFPVHAVPGDFHVDDQGPFLHHLRGHGFRFSHEEGMSPKTSPSDQAERICGNETIGAEVRRFESVEGYLAARLKC